MTRTPLKRKPRRPKPGDDPKYLQWIREQPCVVCDNSLPEVYHRWVWVPNNIEAAHFGRRAIALKPHDAQALPLCAWHHRVGPWAHHHLGSDKLFEQAHGINLAELMAEHRRRYATTQGE